MNKDLFSYIFRNNVLKQKVFSYVYLINRFVKKSHVYKRWNDLVVSRETMASYGYLDLLKLYDDNLPKSMQIYNYGEIKALLTIAVQKGHASILRYFLDDDQRATNKKIIDKSLLTLASKSGYMDVIEYLEGLSSSIHWDYLEAFALSPYSRSLEVVKHFSNMIATASATSNISSPPQTPSKLAQISRRTQGYNVFSIAAHVGRIDIIEWLSSNRPEFRESSDMYTEAASGKHLHVLQYLMKENKDVLRFDNNMIEIIISTDCIDIVKWYFGLFLQNPASQVLKVNLFSAAMYSLEIFKWLNENTPVSCTENAMNLAASNGNLEVVKYLHEKRTEGCTEKAMDNAASNGFIEVVRFLHENRTEGCTSYAMASAARMGSLEVVQFLHENRTEECPPRAIDNAATNGHLNILKFLHENRPHVRGTADAMDRAAYNRHLDVIKWMHENRAEGCTTEAMDEAANCGSLEIVQWLHENRTEGCTTYAMDNAACSGHLKIVQWLHENRTEGCTTKAMNDASAYGFLPIVQWLHENRTEGCTATAIERAALYGYFGVVKYLHENITPPLEFNVKNVAENANENGFTDIAEYLSKNYNLTL